MSRRSATTAGATKAARLPVVAALLAVVIALAAAAPADARRLFVPRQHKTIQRAVDAAQPGDTVWVSSGVYPGSIVVKKSLTLFGDGGPQMTILDGGDSVRVLHIEGVKGASIVGFQIRRGKAPAGGGIFCSRDSAITITSCLFMNNWESALSLWGCGDINLSELHFVENEGSALTADRTMLLLRNSVFEKNRGYAGGAIAATRSRFAAPLRGVRFIENRATGATGGALNLDSTIVNIGDCFFRDNTAAVAGGAIAVMNGARVNIGRTRFDMNGAKASGAVHVDAASFNISYSIFVRNRSTALGSSIGLVGRNPANVLPILANMTFYRDSTEGDGGSIFCEGVSPEIRRNIFSLAPGQKAVAGASYSPLYECNLIHDPTGAALASLPSVETLVGDPLFCDPELGNFFVRDLSPAALAKCGPIGALPKRCSSFQVVPSR